MQENFDVAVCGAGPAGACAAYYLAKAGLKTTLIERQALPRHKTCGGGIPKQAQEYLEGIDLSSCIDGQINKLRNTYNFKRCVNLSLRASAPDETLPLWMVQRSTFDNALAQRAAHAGARLLESIRVKEIEPEGDGLRIRGATNGSITNNFSIRARYVIGADGANGICAKIGEVKTARELAIATEIELEHRWGDGAAFVTPDTVHLDFGCIAGGYGWVFPKRTHLNVGAGVFWSHGGSISNISARIKDTIGAYVRHLGLELPQAELTYYSHPLPLWSGKAKLSALDGRLLLAGDAASMIGPFFGDGIFHALRTGTLAAQAIIGSHSKDYAAQVNQLYGRSFGSARRYAQIYTKVPAIFYSLFVADPRAGSAVIDLLSAKRSYDSITARLPTYFGRQIARVFGRQTTSSESHCPHELG